jgi:glyoxylase-like metal-dependent hydrolase (beta-lactamase superfamily II)
MVESIASEIVEGLWRFDALHTEWPEHEGGEDGYATLRSMAETNVGEVVPGLWRFDALHPEWTEEESGEDGWEQNVAWWALAVRGGLVLIDPLVDDWDALDRLVAERGRSVAIVRTCHWHQRSIAEVADRYHVDVWAKRHADGRVPYAIDHVVGDRDEPFEGVHVVDVERADEIGLWLSDQRALIFGDAMVRDKAGKLRICPESWTQPEGGPARLRALLRDLTALQPEHILTSHGPLVLGGGLGALQAATG